MVDYLAFFILVTRLKIVHILFFIVYVLNFLRKKELDLQYFWGINNFGVEMLN